MGLAENEELVLSFGIREGQRARLVAYLDPSKDRRTVTWKHNRPHGPEWGPLDELVVTDTPGSQRYDCFWTAPNAPQTPVIIYSMSFSSPDQRRQAWTKQHRTQIRQEQNKRTNIGPYTLEGVLSVSVYAIPNASLCNTQSHDILQTTQFSATLKKTSRITS